MKVDEMLGVESKPAAPVKRGRKKRTPALSETWCKKVVALPTEKLVRQREALGTIIINEYPLACDTPEKERAPEYIQLACQLADALRGDPSGSVQHTGSHTCGDSAGGVVHILPLGHGAVKL